MFVLVKTMAQARRYRVGEDFPALASC